MRNALPASLAAVVLFLLAPHVRGQVTAPTASGDSAQGALLPYTAEFKSTIVRKLPDGGSVTTESTEIAAVDSKGRRMHSSTTKGQQSTTEVYVADPVTHTLSYWTVPGAKAQIMDAPDVGVDTDCSRKMKAINPLHPAGLPNLPIEDLGTKTVLGIPARGGRVVFMQGPVQRTNELWTATDTALEGLAVLTISKTGETQTFTHELTKFKQSEPDPELFVMPTGREITRKSGMEYYCDIRPGDRPAAAASPK